MNSFSQSKQPGRRWFAVALAAAVAGGSFWALGASNDKAVEKRPPVSVQVDNAPLERRDVEHSFSPIVKRVAPSVVEVTTEERARDLRVGGGAGGMFDDPIFRYFFGPSMPEQAPQPRRGFQPPVRQGLGSGVIVSPEGYILTNNHVVEGADTVRVELADGRRFTADVVGTDPATDLAVIKVDAKDLPAVTFADSNDVEVGDRVLAIGNPFNLGQTVTTGIVSGKGRSGAIGLAYEDFIQTDAAINPGNSGGALVDMKGRLVGINTAIYSRSGGFQGVGFAIPSTLARTVMDSLVNEGRVTRAYLGVTTDELTPDLAERKNVKDAKGVLVTQVHENTPAEKAGLQFGDVITHLNGEQIENYQRFRFAIASMKPGTEVKLTVMRQGKPVEVAAELGEMPGARQLADGRPGNRPGGSQDGVLNDVAVGDITPAVRRQYQIPDNVEGAVVLQLDPNGAAAAAGLRPGDVIREINNQPVRNAEDAVRLTEDPGNYKTWLGVWSRGSTQYIFVDESRPARGR